MIALLTPFFIAFGIGAGIAAVLTILAAVSVTVRGVLMIAWTIAREVVTWPFAFIRGLAKVPDEFREGMEAERRRHARKMAEKAKR